MKRILEPELMLDEAQVKAYAEADFEEPHAHFIQLFQENFADREIEGTVLDLGCGPGDITFRFASAYQNCAVHAVDGSRTMLESAGRRLARTPALQNRIVFIEGMLPNLRVPERNYDYFISNSLLHHLPDPDVLWTTIKRYALVGSRVFVMDLVRPETAETATRMVELYAADEPPVLQRDFYNSLLAAFTVDEIAIQLAANRLEYLEYKPVSDRHVTISGRIR